MMKRRTFMTLLGGAAAWPLAAGAQQPNRVRRIGVLVSGPDDDPLSRRNVAALREGLQKLGWSEGRNLRIDERFAGSDSSHFRAYAEELVALAPDVIVVSGVLATRALQELTRTIPIVFTTVGDPVVNGLVSSIARPEANATGTTNLFHSIAGKWPSLLKEAAPPVVRIGLIFDPVFTGSEKYVASIEAAAGSAFVKTVRLSVHTAAEIEREIDGFAAEPSGGLIIVPPNLGDNLEITLRLAAQHRLPAIYPEKHYVAAGGLMSYGPDIADLWRSGASMYVDRILRGAKVSDLPVQFPTKFELVINLKTAKTLGLTVPSSLLATADEVIE